MFFYDPSSDSKPTPPRAPLAQVVRREERKTISLPKSNLVYELLSPDPRGAIEFLWIEVAPNEESTGSPYSHPGEECTVVVKGSNYHFWVGGEEYILKEGDSIRYDGSVPHRFANLGEETAVVVVAITPPSF